MKTTVPSPRKADVPPDARARSDRANAASWLSLTRAALGTGLSLAGGVAWAGPPYQTDDPQTVEARHLEVIVSNEQTLTAAGRAGTRPQIDFNYGAAQDLELHLATPLAFNAPAQGPEHRG